MAGVWLLSLLGLSLASVIGPAGADPGPRPAAATMPALNVAPVRMEIGPKQRAALLKVTNHSAVPVAVQLSLWRWTQDAGGDALAPDSGVALSPSVARIAPGATQIVRLFRIGPAPVEERAYRVLLDQLPDGAAGAGARVQLRLSMPLFVTADRGAPLVSADAEAGRLRLVNRGGSHGHWPQAHLLTPSGERLAIDTGGPAYLLAGSERVWRVAAPCIPAGSRLIGAGPESGPEVHVPASCP